MDDIKRIAELAGLNELKKDTEFVTLDQATSDAISDYQLGYFDTVEQAINHYARIHKIHPKELATTVNFYLQHPEKLMKKPKTENISNESSDENGFISGDRVRHKEQDRIGTVRGYEGEETAVEFDDEQGEIYYVDNPTLELAEDTIDEPSAAEMFGATELTEPIEGLEGPWRMRNGRVVYYDPREGKYYDRGMDMYLDDQEATELHFGNMSEEYTKFKEDGLPGGYDAWRLDPGYGNEPNEREKTQALEDASDAMDNFLTGDGQAYVADLTSGQLDPEDVTGITSDLISDLIATGRNDAAYIIPEPDFDDELSQMAKEKLQQLGITEESKIDLESAGFMDADDALRIKRMQDLAGIIGDVRTPNNES